MNKRTDILLSASALMDLPFEEEEEEGSEEETPQQLSKEISSSSSSTLSKRKQTNSMDSSTSSLSKKRRTNSVNLPHRCEGEKENGNAAQQHRRLSKGRPPLVERRQEEEEESSDDEPMAKHHSSYASVSMDVHSDSDASNCSGGPRVEVGKRKNKAAAKVLGVKGKQVARGKRSIAAGSNRMVDSADEGELASDESAMNIGEKMLRKQTTQKERVHERSYLAFPATKPTKQAPFLSDCLHCHSPHD